MSIYKIKHSIPESDYPKLVKFIKEHWKENHALVLSKELMDFQHYNPVDKTYNFVVAENQLTNEYDSLQGYIPTWQFDYNLLKNGDYWGAIWKTRDDIDNDEKSIIGVDVYLGMRELPFCQSTGGIGLSQYSIKAAKNMRIQVGYMHQYYMINNDCTSFKIASHVNAGFISRMVGYNSNELEVKKMAFDELPEIKGFYRPFKSVLYLINRYQKHPIFHYDLYGVFDNKQLCYVMVARKVTVNGSSILRIVDVLGELKGSIYNSMQNLLKEEKCEYVDFLNYGIDSEVFFNMGFRELDYEKDEIIIPNYFEPFEQRNIKLYMSYKCKFPYIAFKGDADQDRPNIIINND